MNRIAAIPAGRTYRSDLRAQQAEDTRHRILDAALRVMAGGLASLSVPAVAREAGVSVPTVYRHFGTKAHLLAALYPHVMRRTGTDEVADPRSLDELREGLRSIFDRLDTLDDLTRAVIASPASEATRRATMPQRLARIRRIAESIAPGLSGQDRDRITRLIAILTSSSALRMWRDHLGSSVDEAADDVDWIVRAAIAASTSKDEQ